MIEYGPEQQLTTKTTSVHPLPEDSAIKAQIMSALVWVSIIEELEAIQSWRTRSHERRESKSRSFCTRSKKNMPFSILFRGEEHTIAEDCVQSHYCDAVSHGYNSSRMLANTGIYRAREIMYAVHRGSLLCQNLKHGDELLSDG
jgi:ligand-binding SRPBCC domain-containing protein